jgi:3-hydroxyisobutyrate dehydrogenase-like beta-hydroxyacid dehydrogenase
MRVGVVGLGTMGMPMATMLSEHHEVTAFDIRAAARDAFGGRVASSAREVAESSELVITSLPGPDEVRLAVLDESNGVLAGMAAGSCLVDTTTNSYDVCMRISAASSERGVGFVDAPVTGRPPAMTVFAGGSEADVERVVSVMSPITRRIIRVGGTGAGCIAKLVNQFLLYSNFATVAETLTLAAKGGLDLTTVIDALGGTRAGGSPLETFPTQPLNGEFDDVQGGPLALVAKDMRLVADLFTDLGVEPVRAEWLTSLFRSGEDLGFGDEHFSAVVKVLEQRSQTSLRPE